MGHFFRPKDMFLLTHLLSAIHSRKFQFKKTFRDQFSRMTCLSWRCLLQNYFYQTIQLLNLKMKTAKEPCKHNGSKCTCVEGA